MKMAALPTPEHILPLRIAFVVALSGVFVLALMPAPAVPNLLPSQDKIGHFMAFLALGILGFVAWPRHILAIAMVLLASGAFIEVGQMLTGHRQAELLDWVADMIGVAGALALNALWRRSRVRCSGA